MQKETVRMGKSIRLIDVAAERERERIGAMAEERGRKIGVVLHWLFVKPGQVVWFFVSLGILLLRVIFILIRFLYEFGNDIAALAVLVFTIYGLGYLIVLLHSAN